MELMQKKQRYVKLAGARHNAAPLSVCRDLCDLEILTGKKETERMREKLTKGDVEKIQAEIEHRKLVERKELIEAVKTLNIMRPKKKKTAMKAVSAIWRECSRRQLSWKIIPRLTR